MTDLATTPRIWPLEPPYEPAIEAILQKWMPPGSAIEPLALFRTLAVHAELMGRMRPLGSGILGHGRIRRREREIVIHRVCARAGAEYEWGVHAIVYGRPLGLTAEQLTATVTGGAVVASRSIAHPPGGRIARYVHRQRSTLVGAGRPLHGRPTARTADHRRLVPVAVGSDQRGRRTARALGRALSRSMTPGLLYRIRVEERALVAALGHSYRSYAAHHKRLIPRGW
jgi:hypothetical protein